MCSDTGLLAVTTTCADRASAETLAERLVAEGLAACVQVGADVTSIYRWEGEVRRDVETPVLAKVPAPRLAAFTARLREMHAYDVPQITGWTLDTVDRDYLRWAEGSEDEDA